MNKRAHPGDGDRWSKPPPADGRPEAGYEAWLAEDIRAGSAELDAGLGIAAEQVWKDLGLE